MRLRPLGQKFLATNVFRFDYKMAIDVFYSHNALI